MQRLLFHLPKAGGASYLPLLSPQSRQFLRLIRSPTHIVFLATNVAILCHIKCLSTIELKRNDKRFALPIEELANYEKTIRELDSQNDQVQRQIQALRHPKEIEKQPAQAHMDMTAALSYSNKKFTLRKASYLSQNKLSQKYKEHRAAIVRAFESPSNTQRLFSCLAYPQEACAPEPILRTYTSAAQNTIMLISNSFTLSSLVELNLRNELAKQAENQSAPERLALYRHQLFSHMRSDSSKTELLELMTACLVKLQKLDPDSVSRFFDVCRTSASFASHEQKRLAFHEFKSSHWLNYENSDSMKAIHAIRGPRYVHSKSSDVCYKSLINKILGEFRSSESDTKHIEVALKFAQMLSTDGKHPPTYETIKYLFEKLGEADLLHLQSIVRDALPGYKQRHTALADRNVTMNFAGRKSSHHYVSFDLQNNIDILSSLIDYEVSVKNSTGLNEILRLIKPLLQHSNYLDNTIPKSMLILKGTNFEESVRESIAVPITVVECALDACLKLHSFTFVDSLVQAILLNLIDDGGVHKLVFGEPTSQHRFLCKIFEPSVLAQKVLSDKILSLLSRIFQQTKNYEKLSWLLDLINSRPESMRSDQVERLQNELLSSCGPSEWLKANRENSNELRDERPNDIFLSQSMLSKEHVACPLAI